MFDWKKVRAYGALMSKAERWLMQRCWAQWVEGNDGVSELDYSESYRMLEGFVAGWKVRASLDADELDIGFIERVYNDLSTKRQGKE